MLPCRSPRRDCSTYIDTEMTRMQMKSALAFIQWDTFTVTLRDGNGIFIIDLETLKVGSTVEMEDELAVVDVS